MGAGGGDEAGKSAALVSAQTLGDTAQFSADSGAEHPAARIIYI